MKNFFTHDKALCESNSVGKETRIWAFSHILPNAIIGSNCNICDHVFIENDVIIGNNVTIKSGVQVWDGIRIQDNVFIGPNVAFTNDKFPRSKKYPDQFLNTVIHEGASIGANATILPGLKVGKGAMVGAGAVVTTNVPPFTVVTGNPARIVKLLNNCKSQIVSQDLKETVKLNVGNCQLWPLPSFSDTRGSLTVTEFDKDLPFEPKRVFFVHDVPELKIRGEHAHIECEQLLIALSGSISVVIDDGTNRAEIVLNSPKQALYMPALNWGFQYKFSNDAALCVYASHAYDDTDYIRDYTLFLEHIENNTKIIR